MIGSCNGTSPCPVYSNTITVNCSSTCDLNYTLTDANNPTDSVTLSSRLVCSSCPP
jgi:hypothetical protein